MVVPKVVLIGGAPFVGKSETARCIAARYGYGCIPADDIGKAVGAVTSAEAFPEIHSMDHLDWRDYFTTTPVDVLLEHAARSRERLWPAFDKIIRTHSTWGHPLVLEGYTLWPETVVAARFTASGAIWLACDDLLYESRVRSQPDFYRGAADEEAMIRNVVRRSSRYTELMAASAAEWGATVISVEARHTVDDVADLCVAALSQGRMIDQSN